MRVAALLPAAALTALCGCTAAPVALPLQVSASKHFFARARNPIRHLVLIIQENRSFNDILYGFPGATTSPYGRMKNGRRLPLRSITFAGPDIDHYWKEGVDDWDDGKMDGFASNPIKGTGIPAGRYAYSYLQRSLVRPYWDMARR